MTNKEVFLNKLLTAYTELFQLPHYALVASRNTPEQLAEKMLEGILNGTANYAGEGVAVVCKQLKIKPGFSTIKKFCGE